MYSRYEELRDQHGVSTYRVCKEADIDPAIISRWKQGKDARPGLATLQKLASYFGVPIEHFLEE